MQRMMQLTRRDNTAATLHCVVYSKSLKTGGPWWLGLGDEALRKVFGSVAKPDKARYAGLVIKDALLRCETDTDRLRTFRGETCGVEPTTAWSSVAGTETAVPQTRIKRVKREPGHQPVADADLDGKIHLHGLRLDAGVERIHQCYAAKCSAVYRSILHRSKKAFQKCMLGMNGRASVDRLQAVCREKLRHQLVLTEETDVRFFFTLTLWLMYLILKCLFVWAPPQHFCERLLFSVQIVKYLPSGL